MLKIKFTIIVSVLLLTGVLCRAQETFDYTKIAPHPRLLLDEKDAVELKETIKSSPELKNIHDYIIEECDALLTKSPVTYQKKGPRLLAVSREALKRIFFLSYAYRINDEKAYLDRAEMEINTVCDFNDWNPNHFLDVGEMSMAVAIGYDWLYNDLKGTTKEKVRTALIHHAFETSNNKGFLRDINNWNQVCNAGLVFGALATFEDHPDVSKKIIERSMKSNPLAMEAYAPDGNYPEGPGYWGYGSGFEAMMIAALESALGSDGGLSEMPGFLQSAEYMLFANGPIGMMFNYSDCGSKQNPNIPIFWFAKKMNNPDLLYTEIKWMQDGSFLKRLDDSRLLPAVLIFGQGIDFSKASHPAKNVWAGRGINPVVLVRTDWKSRDSEYLGIKGGTASASHGHMDAGTFVYDSKGLRWAMDFGMQSYYTLESKGVNRVDKSQDSERWGIFKYNNKNHNTLTINDKRHRVDGTAYLIEAYDTKNGKGGEFDLSEIFAGEIKSAVRKAMIKDDAYLEVEDEIVANDKEAKVRWTMATPADVKIINGNTVELSQKGKKKMLTAISKNPIMLKTWESANPGTDYDAPNPGTVMVGFESTVPANTNAKFTVTIKEI